MRRPKKEVDFIKDFSFDSSFGGKKISVPVSGIKLSLLYDELGQVFVGSCVSSDERVGEAAH